MKDQLRINIPIKMKKEIQHLAIDYDLRVHEVCEKLLQYGLDNLNNIEFK